MEMGCSSGRIPLLWVLRTLVVVVALCGHDAQISIVAIFEFAVAVAVCRGRNLSRLHARLVPGTLGSLGWATMCAEGYPWM